MIVQYKLKHVDSLPTRETMEEGVLYLSEKTWMSSHLCACGCQEEIITPHVRGGWRYQVSDKEEITLSPAITNDICDSTYQIQKGYAIL